jgi:hypothetical protein
VIIIEHQAKHVGEQKRKGVFGIATKQQILKLEEVRMRGRLANRCSLYRAAGGRVCVGFRRS